MRLRRIEAVRYGALAGATLGDLGDGLTIVHGPNEAGKSTYTSLVRHVLYRYPTARESEPGYGVAGDGRCARLVIEDASGTWVIERTEGPHGGRVTIKAIAGADRPDLLGELTRGVSELAYRTVLGFGLGDMAAIEELRGSGDSVISRLYAASAGLRVSPQEVRASVDREAAELFKPSGRKPPLNALIAEVRAVRGALRQLRAEAESFMVDQERLAAMTEQLESAREARDAARERATELAVAQERAEEKVSTIAAHEEGLIALRRERQQLEEEASALHLDVALLAAAPDMDAVLDEAAGNLRSIQALGDLESALARAEVREADAVARTGLAPDVLEALRDAHACTAAVEEAREDLQRLQIQVEARSETVRRSVDAQATAELSLRNLTDPLGITGEPGEAIAERLAMLDALEATRSGVPTVAHHGIDVPAMIMLVSGLVALAAGVVLREWMTVGIGAVLVAAGAVFTLRARPGAPLAPAGDEREYLKALGLESDAGSLEISRARRALEAARTAALAVAAAKNTAAEAERDLSLTSDALQTRTALWSGWLASRGLDPTLTPAAASALLGLVHDAHAARAAAEESRRAHGLAVEQLDAFTVRLTGAARPFVDVPADMSRADIPALANRLRDALAAARTAASRHDEIARAIAGLDAHMAAETERQVRAGQELLELLGRYDLAEGGTHEELRLMRAHAERDRDEATVAFDELAQARHQLEGRLESGARERRTGELHLEESGLVERLDEALDRYLVLAVASRLLEAAQVRYQRERQPEVVRSASRHFTTMTGGRYVGLTVPLGDGRIEVFDERAGARTSDVLSRGTAEQLYLAIRIGLIEQLGEAGSGLPVLMDDVLVNFDPLRRRGAAEAVAELASGRQVVFFTCHPDTADLLAEVVPDHVRLELPRVST